MGNRYLTDLALWCREEGIPVTEVDGWQHRARSSGGYDADRPWAVMWHHTASATSPQNDVNYMCYGSQDAPLANLLLDRGGMVWVMAGGATNTNGKGGPYPTSRGMVPVDQMNTHAVSIEAANNGVGEWWPQVQIDAYFALSLMLTSRLGLQPSDICEHNTWAPDRKVDPAVADAVQGPWQPLRANSSGTWNQQDVIDELWQRAEPVPPGPGPQPPTEEAMIIYAFHDYANTFSDTGVALTPEAYNAMVAAGAIVVVSQTHEQHIESLLHLSGLDRSALIPK